MKDQEVKVLLEDLRSNFKAFAEALDGQGRKIDKLGQTLTEMNEKLALVEIDVRFIRNQLSQKIDREEFETLENRVIILEKKLKKA